MQLASSHGVKAANGQLLSHPCGAALAVERFDRSPGGGRVFVQSLAAILNDGFCLPKLDYEDLYKVSAHLSDAPESERIYRQACFNVALSMKNDHSKNFAFLMGADGRWTLSPAFDMCPSDGPGGRHAMSIAGVADHIGRNDLVRLAKKMDLPDFVVKDGIDQALAPANAFAPLAIDLGAQKSVTKKWQKVFKEIEGRIVVPMIPVNPSTPTTKKVPKYKEGLAP